MMAFDRARIPDALIDAYKEDRCGLLVGAGASVGAGLPDWPDLLKKMVEEALAHRTITDAKAKEYDRLIADPSKFLLAAGSLKDDLSPYFDGFVEKVFITSDPQPTKLHEAVVQADKLKFVITTNYDTVIETAYRKAGNYRVSVNTFTDAGEVQRRLAKREFFILKAHGDAAKIGNGIILTESDYRQILYRERAYQSLLSAMFTMFSIVFVGASMNDPEIKLLLGYIADAFSPTAGPTHFALMPEDEITEVERERWRREMKVELIPISKAHNFAEVTEFVEALHAA